MRMVGVRWMVSLLAAVALVSVKPAVTKAQNSFSQGTFVFEDFADVEDWQLVSGVGTITTQEGLGVVEGDATGGKQLWTVFGRSLELDVQVHPILELKVDDVTDRWFLYLQPKDGNGALVVVKMDVSDTGIIQVDLRDIRVDTSGSRLTWAEPFRGTMLIGASGASATLKYVVFDYIVFRSAAQ